MSILTSQEHQFFKDNGYLIVRQLIESDVIKDLRKAVMEVLDGKFHGFRSRYTLNRPDGTLSTQIQQLYWAHPKIAEYIYHPRLGAIASELMGNTHEVRLWHDQIIHKEPFKGGAVNWHQDYLFWQYAVPADMVTSWTALSKSTVESGCMHVIPGSHKWGLMKSNTIEVDAFGSDPEHFLKYIVKKEFRHRIVKQPLNLDPGDVSFHHCLTMHGSYNNKSSYHRLGYILHYFSAHTRYVRKLDISNEHVKDALDGELIRGKALPLIWSSSENKRDGLT